MTSRRRSSTRVTIALNHDYYSGRKFVIVHARRRASTSSGRGSTASVLDNAWFRHDQLADGGSLDLWLGAEPNKQWGVAQLPPSESKSEHRKPVNATAIAISGPDAVHVPYETVDFDAKFTPENASLKEAYWTVTEPDGSPTDKATITNGGELTVNRLSGPVKVTATAADSGRVSASKLVALDLDVSLLRSNAARWPGVTATASSEFSGYPASRVFDGFERDAADWASQGEQNPWVKLNWQSPIKADRIVLYDRTSRDDANGGTLLFSDGSSRRRQRHPGQRRPEDRDVPHARVLVGEVPGQGRQRAERRAARVRGLRRAVGAGRALPRDASTGDKVSWTPPRFDGGAPVTGYRVRGYSGGQVVAEKTVDGLETTMPAADEYRVAAINVIGTGPERGEPVFATRIDVSGPDRIEEPNATATYTAAFTPADTTYKDVEWTVTDPDGAPTEVADIGADGVLRANTRSGQVLVTASNADGGPAVHGTKLVTIDIDADAIRENAALWPGVTATASSVFSSAFGAGPRARRVRRRHRRLGLGGRAEPVGRAQVAGADQRRSRGPLRPHERRRRPRRDAALRRREHGRRDRHPRQRRREGGQVRR